jgi:hypothetical protein
MSNFSYAKGQNDNNTTGAEVGAINNEVDRYRRVNASPKAPVEKSVHKKSHLLEISIAEDDDLNQSSENEGQVSTVYEEHSKAGTAHQLIRPIYKPNDKDKYKIS